MRHILLAIFAIIFFSIGSNSEILARTDALKDRNILLVETTESTAGDLQNNSAKVTDGKNLEKQFTLKIRRKNEYYLEKAERRSSSFELNFFLIMITITTSLAVFDIYGNKGRERDYQRFD